MEIHYKLHNIREIAGEDEGFVSIIIEAFLEEVPEAVQLISEGLQSNNHEQVYQNAHKIKPTIQQFELNIYDELVVLQDWGKDKKQDDVMLVFEKLQTEVEKVQLEMKNDFNL